MFEREHHRRIAVVLQSLDPSVLALHHCLFGGGTAIALRYGEFRESVDIDFLVSDVQGYRALRQLLTGPEGVKPLLRPGMALQQPREVRADQYGIRTLIRMGDSAIKFEIVREARITLELPGEQDVVYGVPALVPLDLAASKLLANSDRWMDAAVFSRDLIDLAMMTPPAELLRAALAKAEAAYGPGIRADLAKAIASLRQRPLRLDQCMQAMRMNTISRALLWQRVRNLERAAR